MINCILTNKENDMTKYEHILQWPKSQLYDEVHCDRTFWASVSLEFRHLTLDNAFMSPNGDIIIPPLHRRWNGGILDSPWCLSGRLSVRPSVCKQGFRNFLKKLLAQFISYLAFILMGWVSWPLLIFVFLASSLAFWWPNIWLKMGFPELFEKNYWPNSFHTWHLPLWGESLDPYTFSCS